MGSERETMQADLDSSGGASDCWDDAYDDYYYEEDEEYEKEEDKARDDDDGYESDELPAENMAELEDMVAEAAGLLRGKEREEEKPWTILTEEGIRKKQEEAISTVEAVLSIRRTEASLLLRNMEWCVNRVNEEWFGEEERVRESVGLLVVQKKKKQEKNSKKKKKKNRCDICLENIVSEDMMRSTDYCNHGYCLSCWEGYVRTSINDGPGYCLSLRCPHPQCKAAVGDDLILSLLSSEAETSRKYKRFILRSYVDANRKVKWCPAPGCENAVEHKNSMASSSSSEEEEFEEDVTCTCGFRFCWNCLEEAHRPVDCPTVSAWMSKISTDAGNVKWMLANSKPCPKCNRPIEKNNGCMHMTCRPPCKHEFCWLCLGSWASHSMQSGYDCNRFREEEKKGLYNEDEKRKEMAKIMLDRYCHYYERWVSNENSRLKAMAELRRMLHSKMEQLSDKQSVPMSQLQFLTEAWEQIIECRRVLKWTYAYGYYVSDAAKKRLFEYLQGEAEAGLERLHKCAEEDVEIHLHLLRQQDEINGGISDIKRSIGCRATAQNSKDAGLRLLQPSDDRHSSFNEFRVRLIDLTTVTRNYFRNLVRALENGLADVQH